MTSLQHRSPLTYRPDIDGLRALAVLAVVLYHYTPEFAGGFIGVDIFFVISGYLITKILVKAFSTNNFSLLDFYQRRVRRIFPALILILFLCLIFGWFFIFPPDYQLLGKHIVTGAGFAQNLSLWNEAGYFDKSGIFKPLLHLWSLAVEEQFYIFWPLILWLALRLRWPLLSTIATIAALSFAANVWFVWQGDATRAFYFPTTRAWELMVGAWLAVGQRQGVPALAKYPHIQSFMGLLLLLLGFIFVRAESGFPGWWALFPVVGASLVISAGPFAWANQYIFSRRWMVAVGLISYPLYLWHWVLLSLQYVAFGELGSHWQWELLKTILLLASFVLSWLTYRYLEQPIRKGSKGKSAATLVMLVLAVALAGFAIYQSNGVPQRTMNQGVGKYLASMSFSHKKEECFNLRTYDALNQRWYCVLGDKDASVSLVAYGDSHSMAMLPALERYAKEHDVKVIYAGMDACLPLLGVKLVAKNSQVCAELGERIADLARQVRPQAVLMIQRWVSYTGGDDRPEQHVQLRDTTSVLTASGGSRHEVFKRALAKTLLYYHSLSIPVLLLRDNPQQNEDRVPVNVLLSGVTDAHVNASAVSLKTHLRNQALANSLLNQVVGKAPLADLLNTDSALCSDGRCPWAMDGQFLYHDGGHLSEAGALRVYPLLEAELNKMLDLSERHSD